MLEHQPYDCTIDFIKGEQPPFWPIYNLSQDEIVMFWTYMDENLDKGFIQHSKSPNGVSILFVKKEKNDSLWMCIDYYSLNQLTIKN